jgi:putative intracellular protease/amidase
MTVCTGSALLARTGLLDGKKATSNKRAFAWAKTNSEKVIWDNKARWTIDEKY